MLKVEILGLIFVLIVVFYCCWIVHYSHIFFANGRNGEPDFIADGRQRLTPIWRPQRIPSQLRSFSLSVHTIPIGSDFSFLLVFARHLYGLTKGDGIGSP